MEEDCTQACGSTGCAANDLPDLRPPTLIENVDRQLAQAKSEVERLTELKRLLQRNPEVQRILELMGRSSRGLY